MRAREPRNRRDSVTRFNRAGPCTNYQNEVPFTSLRDEETAAWEAKERKKRIRVVHFAVGGNW